MNSQYSMIQEYLLDQIGELSHQNSEYLSQSIYALETIDDHSINQIEQRLCEEREANFGKRLVLMSFLLKNTHCIIVLIEVNDNDQVIRAEYAGLNSIPEELQAQLNKAYPSINLHRKDWIPHDDFKVSLKLNLQNLLSTIQNNQCSIMTDSSMSSLSNTRLNENQSSNQSSNEGNENEVEKFKQELSNGLQELKIRDASALPQRIKATEGRIREFEEEERGEDVLNEEERLRKLQHLRNLADRISRIDIASSRSTSNELLEVPQFKPTMNSNSAPTPILHEAASGERAQKTKQQIQGHKDEDRTDKIEKETERLSKPEEIGEFNPTTSIPHQNDVSYSSQRADSSPNAVVTENVQQHPSVHSFESSLRYVPSCAEKTILELLKYFTGKSSGSSSSLPGENIEVNLLDQLDTQIRRQELFSADIQICLQNLRSAVHSGNSADSMSPLQEILKKIRPLDTFEALRLVAKAKEAASLIAGKDIVLLIGETGSGKSTTIQFLAGSRMAVVQVQIGPDKFLRHITAVGQITNPGLQNITTSPHHKSETRYIAPVTISLQEVLGEPDVLILCDAPGFSDTAGAEVDLANSVGVLEALIGAKSVKLLALSNFQNLGKRGEGIRKIARILVSMIKQVEDRLDAIVYAFTQYPDEDNFNINTELTSIRASNESNDSSSYSDSAFRAVLTDMIDKTDERTYRIDPLRDDRKVLIRKLKRTKGIPRPDKVFQFSMSDETRAMIASQVEIDKSNITSAMKHKDNELIVYYLDDMEILYGLTKQSSIQNAYDNSIRNISENISSYCEDRKGKFNRALASKDGLRDEDVHEYKSAIEYLQDVQILKKHLGSSLVSPEMLIQNIISQIKGRMTMLEDENEALCNPLVGIYLNNLSMLMKYFTILEQHYRRSCSVLKERFDKLVQSAYDLIPKNSFKELAQVLLGVSKSSHILKNHLDEQTEHMYYELIEKLLKHLNSYCEKTDSLLQKLRLDSDDIELLKGYMTILTSASENSLLQDRISPFAEVLRQRMASSNQYRLNRQFSEEFFTDLNTIHRSFMSKIVSYFDAISTRIDDLYKRKKDHALEEIHKLIEDMKTIRSISELIDSKTAGTYYRTVENINGYMQELQIEAERLIVAIEHPSGTINYRYIAQSLTRLKNADWTNSVSPGTYDNLMHRLTEDLVQHASELEGRLMRIDCGLKYPDNVVVAQKIVDQIECMSTLENAIPELEKYRTSTVQRFLQCAQTVFDRIQKTFNLQDKEVYLIKQKLKDFEETEKEFHALHPALVFLRKSGYSDIIVLNKEIEQLKSEQQIEVQRIETGLRTLDEQINRLQSYVDEYVLLSSSKGTSLTKKLSSLVANTSAKKKTPADEYLDSIGYSSIDKVYSEIVETRNSRSNTVRRKEKSNEDFQNALSRLHAIKKQHSSLFDSHQSISREELDVLQKQGFDSIELLREAIRQKRFVINEREKSEQTYDFSGRIDAPTAESALSYFSHCERVNQTRVRENATDGNENLLRYLSEYGRFLHQEIERKFDLVSRTPSDSDRFHHCQDLSMRLQDLTSLERYTQVFNCIEGKDKIEYWQQYFLRYYRTLTKTIQTCFDSRKNQELKEQLNIAYALMCIDFFCGPSFSTNGFGALYSQYHKETVREYREVYKTVLGYISKEDYASADIELSKIADGSLNAQDIAQIGHDVQTSLNKLINETRSTANWLIGKIEREEDNRSEINKIKGNIEKVRIAASKQRIKDLLDARTRSSLESFDGDINKILSKVISRSHVSIEAFIEINNFSEAERGIENLRSLQSDLTDCYTSDELDKKTNELSNQLDGIVKKILNESNFTEVNSFSSNPPKILLEKLMMVPPGVSVRFTRAYNKISERIQDSLDLAITKARTAPLHERTGKVQALSSALCFVPQDIQTQFRGRIDELVKECTTQNTKHTDELKALVKRSQNEEYAIQELGKLAQQYKDAHSHEFLRALGDQCLMNVQACKAEAHNSDIQSSFEILRKISEYKKYLGVHIPEIISVYASVREMIVKGFLHYCEALANLPSIEYNQYAEQTFSDMMIYLKSSISFVEIVGEFFTLGEVEKARNYLQEMSRYFNENSTTFQNAFAGKNINELYNTMVISKKWDRLVQNIKQCTLRHELVKYLLDEIKTVMSYSDMVSELEKFANHLKAQLSIELISDETTKFESKRDEFFKNLMSLIEAYRSICSKFHMILPSLSVGDRPIIENLKNKIEIISQQLLAKASRLAFSLRDADDFRMYYNHLASFHKYVRILEIDVKFTLDKAVEHILAKIVTLRQEVISPDSDVIRIADALSQMKFIAENVSMLDTQINMEIDEALKTYRNKQGAFGLTNLTTILEQTDIGARIISEHSCLSGEDRRKRREKMQKQDNIDYALKELKGDDISRDVLRSSYEIFLIKYNQLKNENLKHLSMDGNKEPDVQALVAQIKYIVEPFNPGSDSFKWSANFQDQIPDLLAHIFAIWTLQNTEHYNAMRGIRAEQSYLLMPHVGQIIAIFRLLGIGYESYRTFGGYRVPRTTSVSKNLVNNLVELGTGEGKSVVLAITACVFALVGVHIHCSCYSEVLSTRDRNDFTSVFRALGIEERIEYGTFNKLCEQSLNKQCNVRERVREMILTNQRTINTVDASRHASPKILLIDEVDVFLSNEFYGGIYTPAVCLNKEREIIALLDSIWQNRHPLKTLRQVRTLPTYQSCAVKYSSWMFLFDEAIKDMLAALRSFQSSTYIVQNDKIVYVEGESIVDNVVRGYDTIWAYFHEHDKGNISRNSLEDNVGIIINCGTISYAEMPHEFCYIAGVTGTLSTLASMERDILKTVYQVEKMTYIPSVYGSTNRIYDSRTDVRVVSNDEYFMEIRQEIENVCSACRAILIFFESEDKLMAFYNSSNLSDIKDSVQIIMEKVSSKDRELYIKRAAVERQVTLITRTFGRGTDFICRNQQLLLNGGMHVLQTFFSEEPSEEYQAMGRGARQGDRGSYRMILLDRDLEWVLGATWREELGKISSTSLYKVLSKARLGLYESKCSAKHHGIEQRRKEHQSSKVFMSALSSGDTEEINRFLTDQNKGADLGSDSSRTVLVMDATGSMSGLLTAVKETISTMFERATVVLNEQKASNSSFQMQMAVYRDYDCMKDRLLQSSSWESKPTKLRTFIERIVAEGGGDYPEAIEIGLWHAFQQSELPEGVSQVILIGDAPAKSENAIKNDRKAYGGQAYWGKTVYETPTHYKKELKKLKDKKIPVHTFYLHDGARENFDEIAQETEGHCKSLDIHSTDGAEQLTHFVTEEILRKTGGEAAAQLYQKMFVKKSFTS